MIARESVGIRQRKTMMLAFRVTGTGTAVIDEGGTQATLTDNGVGDWTLTFVRPFRRTPVCTPASLTADVAVTVGTVSSTAVQIKGRTIAASPAAADAVFHLIVVGFFADTQN